MKKNLKYLIIIVIIIVEVIVMLGSRKVKKIDSITQLRFSYSSGYMMNSDTVYEITKNGSKYYANIKPYLVPSDEAFEVEIDEKVINEIIEVLNKYEVSKWDGFSKSDKYVLDGDSFSFSIHMDNGSDIYASGYMMWPKNYGEVKSELNRILGPLYPTKQEK